MNMIKLTQPNDRPLWINADRIEVLHERLSTEGENGACFYIRDDPHYVKETPEQILFIMGQGPKPVSVSEEWIPFETTDTSVCPVTPRQGIEVQLRDGDSYTGDAGSFRWDNRTGYRDADIVAYRIVEDK